MKNLLIALSPSQNLEKDICKAILLETRQYGTAVQRLHDKAFLLRGPKSFQIAMSLARIAEEGKLPFVLCEIETLLSPCMPDQQDSH